MIKALTESTEQTLTADVAIIGAGFAGASTASHLARQGMKVIVIDKERFAGIHSSGRNASLIRQVTSDEVISSLSRRGARFVRQLAREKAQTEGIELLRQNGSLLVASGNRVADLENDVGKARVAGLDVEWLDRTATIQRFPVLAEAPFEYACFCPTDGVVDIEVLLREYLDEARNAGAEILMSTTVSEVITSRAHVRGVRAGARHIRAPIVVNAAGGWANELGLGAGATPMPLHPRRRHLFTSGPFPEASADWPFIWNVTEEAYFRPEAGALLLSACDVSEPGSNLDPDTVDQEILELLAEKISRLFPALRDLTIRNGWSGIRTLTPDGRFIIGPDPELRGFFWVAGLGGHGVTTSAAIGELAAQLIMSPEKDRHNPHSPSRFATTVAEL